MKAQAVAALAAVGVLLALLPDRSGAAGEASRSAATLGEFLTLRAAATAATGAAPADGRDLARHGRTVLASFELGPRALALLYAHAPGVELDPIAGPQPPGLVAALAAPRQPGEAEALLLVCDAGVADPAALAAGLAGPLGLRPLAGGARGGSPLTHLGLIERAAVQRVGALVCVWDLRDDLGETDLLRRARVGLAPEGDVDALLAALAGLDRGQAAQEAWFAARPAAGDAVVAVLVASGFELARRARLFGADLAFAVRVPDAAGRAAAPTLAALTDRVLAGLTARGVHPVAVAGDDRELAEELQRTLAR